MSFAKHYSAKGTIDSLTKWIERLPGALDAELSHVADEIESSAQENARKRTGKMANMTTKKKFKSGDSIGYEVSGTAPYTKFQHDGTRYIEGDPYILNALNEHAPKVQDAIKKVLKPK